MLLDVMRDQHRKRGHEPKQGAIKWVGIIILGAFRPSFNLEIVLWGVQVLRQQRGGWVG